MRSSLQPADSSEVTFPVRFALAALGTWRVTHLLAHEDGPGEILARVRLRLGEGSAGKLMDCFQCLSVWVAAPLACLICRKPADRLLACLALSGAACLLERARQEPVVIQPIGVPSPGGSSHEMLRPGTSGD